MDQNTLGRIQRQLEYLFQGMADADDFTAAKLMIKLSASLLRMSQTMKVDIGSLDGGAFEEITELYEEIAQAVRSFARQLQVSNGAKAEQLVQAGGEDALKQARTEWERLSAEEARLKEELDRQSEENRALSQRLEEEKARYEDSCSRYKELQKKLAEFPPHELERQLEENTRLEEKLARRTEEYETLTSQLKEKSERLRRIEEELETLPEEVLRQGEEFEEKERYLARLKNAEEEFSPKRQKELQDEIDLLDPEVEALGETIQTLRSTLHNLNETYMELDRERQTLETDLLDRINTCLEELSGMSLEHREALEEVSRRADILEENLEKCAELRRRYAAWWEADRTPLETIRDILKRGDPLDEGLSDSLDPSRDSRLEELDSSIRGELEEMDRILAECFRAMQQDRDTVRSKTSRVARG